jgi:WD40 repeat protein
MKWKSLLTPVVVLSMVFAGAGPAESRSSSTAKKEHQDRRSHYSTAIRLAQKLIEDGQIAEAKEALASCPAEHRHWEWGYLEYLCHMDRKRIPADTKGEVCSLSISADGKKLATGGSDNTVRLRDTESGKELLSIPLAEGACNENEHRNVGLHPQAAFLAAVGSSRGLFLRDLKTDQDLILGNPDDYFTSAAFSPDGKHLAAIHQAPRPEGREGLTAAISRVMTLWDLQTKEVLTEFPIDFKTPSGGSAYSKSLVFSPTGDLLATQTAVFDVGSGTKVMDLEEESGIFDMNTVAFNPKGGKIATCLSKHVTLWTLKTGEKRTRTTPSENNCVAFTPDGKFLATGGEDGIIRIWPVDGFLFDNPEQTIKGQSCSVSSLAFTPNGDTLISAGGPFVRYWDWKDARPSIEVYSDWTSNDIVFSSDGKMAALLNATDSNSEDCGSVEFWCVDPLVVVGEYRPADKTVMEIFPSEKGSKGGLSDLLASEIDIASKETLFALDWSTFKPRLLWEEGAGYSKEGRPYRKTLGDPPKWNLKQDPALLERFRQDLGEGEDVPACLSSDGKRAAVIGDRDLWLYDTKTKESVLKLAHSFNDPYSIRFSPDGTQLLAAGRKNQVQLWRAFPYTEKVYEGTPQEPLESRIDRYRERFWSERRSLHVCQENMRKLDQGKDTWILANNRGVDDLAPTLSEILGPTSSVECPSKGTYELNPPGIRITCSKHGSLVPEVWDDEEEEKPWIHLADKLEAAATEEKDKAYQVFASRLYEALPFHRAACWSYFNELTTEMHPPKVHAAMVAGDRALASWNYGIEGTMRSDSEINYSLAQLAFSRGLYNEAVTYFRQAYKSFSEEEPYFDTMVVEATESGEVREITTEDVLSDFVEILVKVGKPEGIIEAYKTLIEHLEAKGWSAELEPGMKALKEGPAPSDPGLAAKLDALVLQAHTTKSNEGR